MALRKVIIGSSVGALCAIPTGLSEKKEESAPAPPKLIRPSDLPIYRTPINESPSKVGESSGLTCYLQSSLQPPIRAVRVEVQNVLQKTESITNSVKDTITETKDKSQWIVRYLREEDHKEQRYGAVAMGGITGFIFGLRGGIIRRLFYTGVGTTIMGAICFPQDTEVIAKNALTETKHYMNIAYNFFYGVKPGDPQLEINFPELSFPKDFKEFVDMSVSLASTVKQAVMPPPSKDESKPSDSKDKA